MARFFGRASGVKIACIDKARALSKIDYDKMARTAGGRAWPVVLWRSSIADPLEVSTKD
jgi:hypothetical protein